MANPDLLDGLRRSISIGLSGAGPCHPSRRPKGVPESKASLLAGMAIETLERSGYILGHRSYPPSEWVNGHGVSVAQPPPAAPAGTEWMLPSGAKKE